jgi:hypothetical protein
VKKQVLKAYIEKNIIFARQFPVKFNPNPLYRVKSPSFWYIDFSAANTPLYFGTGFVRDPSNTIFKF